MKLQQPPWREGANSGSVSWEIRGYKQHIAGLLTSSRGFFVATMSNRPRLVAQVDFKLGGFLHEHDIHVVTTSTFHI